MSVVSVGVGITTIITRLKKVVYFEVDHLIKLRQMIQEQNEILVVLRQVSQKAYHSNLYVGYYLNLNIYQ